MRDVVRAHAFQSGRKNTAAPTGKGNPWIKGTIGEAALSASRSNTFLGARYKRIVKRRGRKRALVAATRSWSSSGTC